MNRPWQPVLEGTLAERARATVEEIAAALLTGGLDGLREDDASDRPAEEAVAGMDSSRTVRSPDVSFASGAAGVALFWAYLARATQSDEDAARTLEYLDAAIDVVARQPMPPGLYGGYSGVAFAVQHVDHCLFDDDLHDVEIAEQEDPNEAIDQTLLQTLRAASEKSDYDLISGIVGLGVYALERLPRPAARACLEAIIDLLRQWADRPTTDSKTWHTPADFLPPWQREIAPGGYHNLGLAHGVPGVIGLLGEIVAVDAVEGARELLEEAVAWLLRQKLPTSAEGVFASWISEGREPTPARSAWCYGDPGASIALLVAARATRNADWEREAITIAKKCAGRPVENTGVKDAAICHGAAGLGHIFNRFYQATGAIEFAEAARFWLQRVLDMRREGKGIAGFSYYVPAEVEGNERWADSAGFLTGAAGIGLVLLAALEPMEPAWDRVLLAAVPR